jgi:carboxyl-terminal processing protease
MRLPRRAALLSFLCAQRPPPALVPAAWAPIAPALAIELSDEQQLLVDAWAVVQRAFYDPARLDAVDWKGARGEYVRRPYKSMGAARAATAEMLGRLGDRYTRYVTPAGYAALLARYERRGDEGGIGVELATAAGSGRVEVVSVAPGSPAARAGIQPGDAVVVAGGAPIRAGASAEEVAARILGPLGETLRLELRRGGGADAGGASPALALELRRAPLDSGEVRARTQPWPAPGRGAIGVVTVPLFVDGDAWFESLRRGLRAVEGADALAIDLRANPGGHFPTGVAAASLFLPADRLVVTTVDRMGVRSPLSTTSAGPYAWTEERRTPTYVLIDRATASAAEVFAGALQDAGRATVLGDTSFGKGIVQTIAKVSDGGAVVCTTARYLTPSGRDLNGIGVSPDRQCSESDPVALVSKCI